MKNKRLPIFVAVTIAVVGLSIVVKNQQSSKVRDELIGKLLFDDLINHVNDVAIINIVSGDSKLVIERKNNAWQIPDKFGYAANLDKVKDTILGVANLELIEAKTKKTQNYTKLGLEDATKSGTSSKQVTLKGDQNKLLANIILGNRGNGAKTRYVRKANDKQSWLAKGDFQVATDVTDWLDADIMDVKASRLKHIEIKQATGSKLELAKNKPEDKELVLLNLAAKKEITSQGAVNNLTNVLENLRLTDVQPIDSITFDTKITVRSEYKTNDGLVINIDTIKKEDKYYSKFTVKFMQDITLENSNNDKLDTKKPQPIQDEASQLQAKLTNWVYVVSNPVGEKLTKKMDDITKSKSVK